MNKRLENAPLEGLQYMRKIFGGLLLAGGYTVYSIIAAILVVPVALTVLMALSPLIFLIAYLRKLLPAEKQQEQRTPSHPEMPGAGYQAEPVYL